MELVISKQMEFVMEEDLQLLRSVVNVLGGLLQMEVRQPVLLCEVMASLILLKNVMTETLEVEMDVMVLVLLKLITFVMEQVQLR